jgi:hypothetical protein
MGKTLKVGGPATHADIAAAYKASQDPHERERLLAIRMGQQGQWTLETMAHVLGQGRDSTCAVSPDDCAQTRCSCRGRTALSLSQSSVAQTARVQ